MPKTSSKKVELTSWEGVNAALLRIKQLEANVASLQGSLDGGIAELQQRYSPQIEPFEQEIEGLSAALGDFVFAHRKELSQDGHRRSRVLKGGRVGLAFSPPRLATLSRVTWKKVLDTAEALPARLRAMVIRTKPEINKNALRTAIEDGTIDEEQRQILGVAVVRDESAYYELT